MSMETFFTVNDDLRALPDRLLRMVDTWTVPPEQEWKLSCMAENPGFRPRATNLHEVSYNRFPVDAWSSICPLDSLAEAYIPNLTTGMAGDANPNLQRLEIGILFFGGHPAEQTRALLDRYPPLEVVVRAVDIIPRGESTEVARAVIAEFEMWEAHGVLEGVAVVGLEEMRDLAA